MTLEEMEAAISAAIESGFRGRLLDRGLSRSMIWKVGVLPEGAPSFSSSLSYDLLSYGYSLMSMALRLKETGGNSRLCRAAFERSASAIMDVIQNGDSTQVQYRFHRTMAAASYHMARYSAKAYSLLGKSTVTDDVSSIEKILDLLILRDIDQLEELIINWKLSEQGHDDVLAEKLDEHLTDNPDVDTIETEGKGIEYAELPIVEDAIKDNYLSSIFAFLTYLETGDEIFIEEANEYLERCLSVCSELNILNQWWVIRVTKYILNDLKESSLHTVIPKNIEENSDWPLLRRIFISTLYKRKKSEVELWPSQLEGAQRSVDGSDNLVLSLPTSAGKTRVAELCILRCLSLGKRVLFITPLRALSAQTESSLKSTFSPLGKSISSLYGSSGTSTFDQRLLQSQDIVIGTPEKLDFAIRNDPSLLNDVGLIVLDEGHMIGMSEREIRYEVQIQRLLSREDASARRIVCLSAILPDGEQFDDFVAWLRQDIPGTGIKSDWRPTDLRFGEVVWLGDSGRVDFTIGQESAFIPNYIQPFIPPNPNPGLRQTEFPKNNQELTLATAWKLVEDNHSVLVYCPVRTSVGSFAKAIVDLHRRGALDSVLLAPESEIELALSLGAEWLGEGHAILECLKIGVAIHHASLPTPFRKELETLLRKGVLKVTISSPTLAQGLNLTATAVIIFSLHRNRKLIPSSEFKNVIGRAGRAFVDTHGLVLHPIFNNMRNRKNDWTRMVSDLTTKDIESGLFKLVLSLILRLGDSLKTDQTEGVMEYILNNADPWEFPNVADEDIEVMESRRLSWEKNIVNLDVALLSLLNDGDISDDKLPEVIDLALQSSLWERRLSREDIEMKSFFDFVLIQRAGFIWSESTAAQRKGYYLAGVGLVSGQKLDAIADEANQLLISANAFILSGELENAIEATIKLAEQLFSIEPFMPKTLPDDWREILSLWLMGDSLTEHEVIAVDDALKFIEDGLIYRLTWGIEAVRVRAEANHDIIDFFFTIDDLEVSLLVPAIENGTLNRSVVTLMQAGFHSRRSAILAVTSTNATFIDGNQLKVWLQSDQIQQLTLEGNWPTPETAILWEDFLNKYTPSRNIVWEEQVLDIEVAWFEPSNNLETVFLKPWNESAGNTLLLNSSADLVGELSNRYELRQECSYRVEMKEGREFQTLHVLGVLR